MAVEPPSTGQDSGAQRGADHGRGTYNIGAVARLLGIGTSTLRTWETRYRVVVPERSSGGQRLYTRDQLEELRFVARLLEQGVSAASAFRVLVEHGGSGGQVDDDAVPRLLVLLAEQDPFFADFATFYLTLEGYEVVTAVDADQAADVFNERSPDVVIIDLLISGGRGIELCRALRTGGTAPVVAVSALASRDEALAAGADEFLLKPLEGPELVSLTRSLTGSAARSRHQPTRSRRPVERLLKRG